MQFNGKIAQILYLPCLGVFARKENRRESCYKLMLFMGLLSMVNINSSGLIIGLYAARGDVFCSRPLFNYLIGMPAFGACGAVTKYAYFHHLKAFTVPNRWLP